MLDCIEIDPPSADSSSGARASVVWLHGLGDSGHGFAPIAEELRLPPELGLRFVFPNAPVRPITINGGMEMRGWYDIREIDLRHEEDVEGLRESQALVEELLRRELDSGVQPHRLLLAGFSQGGAIALQTALRFPEPLAGVLALSTYLTLPDLLEAESSEANRELPIFQAHGTYDPIIPVDAARASKERLEQAGRIVDWREYPMEHSLCAEELTHLRDKIIALLPAAD